MNKVCEIRLLNLPKWRVCFRQFLAAESICHRSVTILYEQWKAEIHYEYS